MPKLIASCPNCKASLKLKKPIPAGNNFSSTCPKCGVKFPLNAVGVAAETVITSKEQGAGDAQTTPSVSGHVPQALPPSANFPFLAPPQKPDELGRLGPYRILGVLGAGGMGIVFRAEDPVLRRQIALKVMIPQFAN